MKHYGDICRMVGAEIEPVDCIIGGSPCQDLSIAGKRAGLAGARSGLYMEQIRIIREMRENDRKNGRTGEFIRPRYMVWENVPGAFSSNKGRDFAAVLEEAIRIAEPEAPDIPVPEKGWPTYGGYRDMDGRWSVAWRVLDAQHWGVPQRRRRIALVADFGGTSAHEILFNRKGVFGHPETSGEAGEGPAGETEIGTHESGAGIGQESVFCLQGNGIDRADTAGCNGKGWREDVSYTLNTIDRPAVCAGFKLGNSEQARSIGYQEEQTPTLNAECGGNKPAVVYSFDSLASNSMKSPNPKSGCREVDTARTLDTTSPDPSKNQGGIAILDMSHDVSGTLRAQEHGQQPAVMAFDTTQITSKQNGSIPDFGKPCHTLNANAHVPCAVLDMSHACDVIRDCREVAPSLQARMGTGGNQIPLTYQMQGFGDYREGGVASSCKQRDFKDGTDLVCAVDCRNFREGGEVNGTLQAKESGGQSLNLNNTVRQNRVVRRLTPMECERLQGFPDHWTDIGAWTDEKWKIHKESSDSARYKALGNSIALPPWKWVLKRICAQYERDATCGSLFDGIGGFPLLWTQLNGWGSVKWASEIEPFCIAVTKRHFGDAETGEAGDLWKHMMGGSDE